MSSLGGDGLVLFGPFVDREGWPKGAWDEEPDGAMWRTKHGGLPAVAIRNDYGAWCGYVGVLPAHPAHGKPARRLGGIHVHGNLTFAAATFVGIALPSVPWIVGAMWWLGFDCGHACDLQPGIGAVFARAGLSAGRAVRALSVGAKYRDLLYVRAQCEHLADQLIELAKNDAMASATQTRKRK